MHMKFEKKQAYIHLLLLQCCGDLPIAFHGYKNPQWLYKIENDLYMQSNELLLEDLVSPNNATDDWREYTWSHPDQTRSYFKRVRTAMGERKEIPDKDAWDSLSTIEYSCQNHRRCPNQ